MTIERILWHAKTFVAEYLDTSVSNIDSSSDANVMAILAFAAGAGLVLKDTAEAANKVLEQLEKKAVSSMKARRTMITCSAAPTAPHCYNAHQFLIFNFYTMINTKAAAETYAIGVMGANEFKANQAEAIRLQEHFVAGAVWVLSTLQAEEERRVGRALSMHHEHPPANVDSQIPRP